MRTFLGLGAVVVVVVAVVGAAIYWLEDDERAVAEVRIDGAEPDVRGVAFFEQQGERMTGHVVVWGLEPNSKHAVHFHGPDSRCGAKADPVAVHPDLQANADGVAYTEIDIAPDRELLDGGFYYNVHAEASSEAENPEIACGDIAPASKAAAAAR